MDIRLAKVKDMYDGQIYKNRDGFELQIIDYNGCSDVTIKFLDRFGAIKKCEMKRIKNGEVSNPNKYRLEREGMEKYNNQGYHMVVDKWVNADEIYVMFDNGAIKRSTWGQWKSGKIDAPQSKEVYKEVIGRIYTSAKEEAFKIIDYVDSQNVTIQFLDAVGYIRQTTMSNIRKGEIMNPYRRGFVGIGYMGEGIYNKNSDPYFNTWYNMLVRCYDRKLQETRHKAYVGCTVHEDWHCYQTFCKWCNENKNILEEGFDLDKDLLIPKNREYGPYTCTPLPREINSSIVIHDNLKTLKKADLETYEVKKRNFQINLEKLAEKYKDKLYPEAYNALMRFNLDDRI